MLATAGRFHRGDTAEEVDGAGEYRLSCCCLQSRSTESKRLKLPVELSKTSEPDRICSGDGVEQKNQLLCDCLVTSSVCNLPWTKLQ